MRNHSLLHALLGLQQCRISGFEFTATGLVIDVRPATRVAYCAGCGRRCRKGWDARERLWRHLDIIGLKVWLRYSIRRVDCKTCGVTTELVPWAAHATGFTALFEEQVAYLAQCTDKTTVCSLMRIAWETAGRIIERVVARLGPADRLDGLRRLGIDELSYRRHHEYVTIVTDHDTGRVVWVRKGKNAETVGAFFETLGVGRTAQLEVVTIDMSAAYIEAVKKAAPQATIVFDRFHVQRLAHEALDQVRRAQVREVAGTPEAKAIKGTRFSLHKRTWNMTRLDTEKVAMVQQTNRPLFRAHMLTHTLAAILDRRQVNVARDKLAEWLGWAARSRLAPFQKAARTIGKYAEGILAYVATGLSNGRSEGLNGKVRTITRRSYGFHSASSLIAMIFLCCTGLTLTPLHRVPDLAAR